MTEHDSIVELLAKSRMFGGLPRGAIEAIAQAVKPLTVPRHTLILHEGAVGDGLYIIRSGQVRIFRKGENRMEIDLAFPGPFETFGEMALLTGEPRSANAEALEETHLLVLAKEDFDAILSQFPETSRIFIREMRRWLLRDEQRLEQEAREAYRASRLSCLDFLVVIGISVMLGIIFNYSNPNGIPLFPQSPDRSSFSTISPAAAAAEVQRGSTLFLDARPENFYHKHHIKGALNMPLPLFDIVYMMTFGDEDKERTIVVYGGTISRHYDLELAEKLVLRGHQKVEILEGGLEAWAKEGYPVEEKAKQ